MVWVSEWLSNFNPSFHVAQPIVSVCAKTLPQPAHAGADFQMPPRVVNAGVNRIVGRSSMSAAESMRRNADDQSAT
jgi:hypothetical protein